MNKYIRKKNSDDKTIHIFTEALWSRGDMEYCAAPGQEEIAPPVEVVEEEPEIEAPEPDEYDKEEIAKEDDRLFKIKAALASIPQSKWGKLLGGKYILPKVAEVSEIAGFKVSVEELKAIVGEAK